MSTTTLHSEKKKTLVPQLRFKEFDGEWELKKLGEIAKIITGSTPSTTIDEYYDGEKLFVSPADIQENRYVYTTKTTLTESGFNKGRKIKKGSVLFVCIGSTIGKVAQTTVECLTNQQINALEANKEFQNDFIYNLLENNGAKIKMLAGVQAVPQINKTDFSNFKYLVPTLPEQKKIASFLSEVDEKIQQLTRKVTLLEQYKKVVMQQLFSGKLRFKDENGKDYPDWEEKKLGEVAKITMGQSPESKSYNTVSNGMLLIQGNADIKDRLTLPRQWTSEPTKTCEIGDLILTVRAPVGSIAKSRHNACIGRGVCSIINNKNSIIEYLYQFFLSYESKWTSLEQGSTFTAVSGSDIKGLKLNLPSIKEQQKIANFLSGIDSKIEMVNKQLAQTQTFKKGLLQQMFV